MKTLITSMEQLSQYFPHVYYTQATTWNSPCPFCEEGDLIEKAGNTFRGDDRLIWYVAQENPGVHCRVCQKWRSMEVLAKYLGLEVLASLDYKESSEPYEASPLSSLWLSSQVKAAHENVRRDYWYRFGWTDEAIDKFMLGYGALYGSEGHMIPMRVTDVSGNTTRFYYIANRVLGHSGSIKTPGSPKPYYWFIPSLIKETVFSDYAILAEGEKDAITASILFPESDVYASFGSYLWTQAKTKVMSKRHKIIWVFGDNDEAGAKFNKAVYGWAKDFSAEAEVLVWGEDEVEKMDVTDLFASDAYPDSRQYIEDHMVDPGYTFAGGVDRPRFIENMKDAEVESDLSEYVTIAELRGSGEFSILGQLTDFVTTYPSKIKRGEGLLKLFAVPPGGGKSHQTLAYMLDIAEHHKIEKLEEKETLKLAVLRDKLRLDREELQESEDEKIYLRMKDNLDNFSLNLVAWFGQYVAGYQDLLALNPLTRDLVFNYEARNIDNCKNFDLVLELGTNQHDIGAYCQLGCSYRDQCRKSGYLAQEIKMRDYPIVYYRHPHLSAKRTANPIRYIVIDENPTTLFDTPLLIGQRDVKPTQGWQIGVGDENQSYAIELFARSIRSAMSSNVGEPQRTDGVENPNYIISGAAFLTLLDTFINSQDASDSLENLMRRIDSESLAHYHPTYISGERSTIRKRCIVPLYNIILSELPAYLETPTNKYPSRLHLIEGRLELYTQEPIEVSSTKPIIALDATALSKLYSTAFSRPVVTFRPRLRNPNAVTIEFRGGGFSKGHTVAQIGEGYREIETILETAAGQQMDSREIPISPFLYESSLIKEAFTLIKGLAEKHDKLLVITHKILRKTLEWILNGNNEDFYDESLLGKIAFAHFNQIRGTNKYAKFDSVLILGAYRIPYDVAWRKINAWMYHMGDTSTVSRETIIEDRQFHEQESGNGIRTFDHPFAKEYLDMVEAGELMQCAERIRPHASDGNKFIYCIGSRPSLLYVTDIWSRQILYRTLSDDKIIELEKMMIAYAEDTIQKFGEISFPAVRTLQNEWGLNNRSIQMMLAIVIPKLLREYPDARLAKKYYKYKEKVG